MTSTTRWAVVTALVILVVTAPLGWRARPVSDVRLGADVLLTRVMASRDHAYSGYVESEGSLQLPATPRLSEVDALLSGITRMRVWWRSVDDWRVDRLLVSGETDLVHHGLRTSEWSYEGDRVRLSDDPPVRLPRTSDLLPPALAGMLFSGTSAGRGDQLSRLDPRRVAGRDALGVRLSPGSPLSSIDHADLWTDRETFVPLRVEVYAAPTGGPSFVSQFLDFQPSTPDVGTTRFVPPPGAHVSYDGVVDIADATNRYAPVVPPPALAGLPRSPGSTGAVGIYGSGATRMVAVPMRGQDAAALRLQLQRTPGSRAVAEGTVASAGPIGVLVTGEGAQAGWLLSGTVTAAALEIGAVDLSTGARTVGSGE